MKRRLLLGFLIAAMICAQSAKAQGLGGLLSSLGQASASAPAPQQGVIVRTTLGLTGLKVICLIKGCQVVGNLDGGLNQVFLVRPMTGLLPSLLAGTLKLVTGIVDVEVDQVVNIPTSPADQAQAANPPSGLFNNTPVSYYGTSVPSGYVNQPATQIIRLAQAQSVFNVSGAGIIADIDTGVDPQHPALAGALLQGYDFTRNQPGGSEMTDIGVTSEDSCTTSNPCSSAYVNQHTVAMLDQHTAAMLDQHTAAMVDGTQYAAFGHGTMVAGILHLTAPAAKILPVKSFQADGTASLSNIIQGVYYAVQNHANVINMSFNLASGSQEFADAVSYAINNRVTCVASSGNDGMDEVVYPAGLPGVMGVASTNNSDQRSTFSNYGDQVVWVAAPGEAVVTTFPFGFYAAGWGTSFSSPFVAGTASLLVQMMPVNTPGLISFAVGHAKPIGPNMGQGRLDVYGGLSAINPVQGLLQ